MAHPDRHGPDLAYADTLCKSADALDGQVDAAAYMRLVLDPLLRKCGSDTFTVWRQEITAGLNGEVNSTEQHVGRTRNLATSELVMNFAIRGIEAKVAFDLHIRSGRRTLSTDAKTREFMEWR